MEMKERTSYSLGMFDLAKGLGIIQIVLFHSVFVPKTNEIIVFFLYALGFAMMGMFFSVNGFGMREYSMKKGIKISASMYLVPYIYVTAVVLILFPLIRTLLYSNLPYFLSETRNYFVTFLMGQYYPVKIGVVQTQSVIVVWFFWALFWGTVFLNGILKIRNHTLRVLCIAAITVAGIFMEEMEFGLLCIFRGCLAVPTMYIGYTLKQSNINSRKFRAVDAAVCIGFVVTLALEWEFEEYIKQWHLLTLLRVTLECVLGYYAILFSIRTLSWEKPIAETIRRIGRYSYWIMCIHFIEEICIPWYEVPQYFPNHQTVCFFVIVLLRSLIIFAGVQFLKFFNSKKYALLKKKRFAQNRKGR